MGRVHRVLCRVALDLFHKAAVACLAFKVQVCVWPGTHFGAALVTCQNFSTIGSWLTLPAFVAEVGHCTEAKLRRKIAVANFNTLFLYTCVLIINKPPCVRATHPHPTTRNSRERGDWSALALAHSPLPTRRKQQFLIILRPNGM